VSDPGERSADGARPPDVLAHRLARGPLPVDDAVRIAAAIARALAGSHARGVSHRELDPGRILLHAGGAVEVVAAPRAGGDSAARAYRPPEQRRGAPEDERSDVFAIGALLFHMLAGEPPFRDDAAAAAGRVPLLDVPDARGLGEAIVRMLDADPVERPRDAAEVAALLEPFAVALEHSLTTGSLPPVRRRRRRRVRTGAWLAATLAIAVAAGWIGHALRGRSAHPVAAAEPSVAVLPFEDLSPGKEHAYFVEGLADELIAALGRVEGLRVPGRTSSFWFKGRNASLAEIGSELRVATVLQGSVRVTGSRVRVSAQLVNVAGGQHLWGQTYDRELGDVLAVQEEIARAVADALAVRLVPGSAPPPKPDAHAKVLLGRQQYHRSSMEALHLAVRAYEEALAIDPGYGAAWAGLALPLFYTALDGKTSGEVAAVRQRALDAAERAVALSPGLAEALSARGTLRGLVRYDWDGARADLARALALNANDADAHRRYAGFLALGGRFEAGIAEARRATELDPLGPAWATLGALYEQSGALDLAEVAFRRDLELTPDAEPAIVGLGRTLLLAGRPRDALATFARSRLEAHRLWGEAVARHTMGDAAASDAALRALVAGFGHTALVRIAEAYAWRGETQRSSGSAAPRRPRVGSSPSRRTRSCAGSATMRATSRCCAA
jgi:TolB-like protein/Tfp pilus assembly protein PilF